jgi:hypothetical protein
VPAVTVTVPVATTATVPVTTTVSAVSPTVTPPVGAGEVRIPAWSIRTGAAVVVAATPCLEVAAVAPATITACRFAVRKTGAAVASAVRLRIDCAPVRLQISRAAAAAA